MFDRLEFLLSEAFTALRRNPWMTFAAITTSCMALFLTAGVAFAIRGVNQYAATLPSQFEIRVFMQDGVNKDDVTAAMVAVKKIPSVRTVVWTPRDKAWADFKKANPEYPTTGLENPLPEALTVTVDEVDKAPAIAEALAKVPKVAKDGVLYLRKEREMLSQALGFLRTLGLSLGTLMVLTSAVLIYNAIRMTIVARKREFRIMRLVGANASTILVPLLIEGAVVGMVGGLLASGLIQGTHWYLTEQFKAFSGIVQMGPLTYREVVTLLLVAGAIYGLVCSTLAIRDYQE